MLLFCQVVPNLWLPTCWLAARYQVVGTTCNKAVEFIKLVASLLQACIATCQQAWDNQCEHILSTSCCSRLVASLLQVCYNLQVVRFYVCKRRFCNERRVHWSERWSGIRFLRNQNFLELASRPCLEPGLKFVFLGYKVTLIELNTTGTQPQVRNLKLEAVLPRDINTRPNTKYVDPREFWPPDTRVWRSDLVLRKHYEFIRM